MYNLKYFLISCQENSLPPKKYLLLQSLYWRNIFAVLIDVKI